jgi:hypothetical protein
LLHGEDKLPDLSEAICVLEFLPERLDNFGNMSWKNTNLMAERHHTWKDLSTRAKFRNVGGCS